MKNSKIEWCDHTINWWWGCTKVSPACDHCYAERQASRFHTVLWGIAGDRSIRVEAASREAMKYQRRAEKEGRRFRVFTNSMSDFFEDRADLDGSRLEALDVMRQTPNLDWLILTKRPENIMRHLGWAMSMAVTSFRMTLATWLADWITGRVSPENVWLGTTVEDQERAEQRVRVLVKIPAALHFLSCEPLLGPVDLESFSVHAIHPDNEGYGVSAIKGVDWVIAGGESGPRSRPMQPDWARSLRDQCAAAGVPFLFKQWGKYEDRGHHGPSSGDVAVWPDGTTRTLKDGAFPASREAAIMRRAGKVRAGRMLDGVEHNGYPEVE